LELGEALTWFFVAFIVIGAAFFTGIILGSKNQTHLRQLWNDQWYCKTCGDIFFPRIESEQRCDQVASRSTSDSPQFVSPVIRASTGHPRAAYVERSLNPIQRARSASGRDLSGLAEIRVRVAPDGSFNPEQMRLDLGVHSRLSSLGLITYDQQRDRFEVDVPSPEPRRSWWQQTFG
jgi:hypothetical protein